METEFWIDITFDRRVFRFHVVHLPIDKTKEHFILTHKNRSFTFESNRPFVKWRVGLKRWEPKFELVHGEMWNIGFRQLIIDALKAETKKGTV